MGLVPIWLYSWILQSKNNLTEKADRELRNASINYVRCTSPVMCPVRQSLVYLASAVRDVNALVGHRIYFWRPCCTNDVDSSSAAQSSSVVEDLRFAKCQNIAVGCLCVCAFQSITSSHLHFCRCSEVL